MASKATKQQPNKCTYASAVVGVAEKSHFSELAVCRLNIPKNLPNKHIPNTKEEYSFFIDRLSTNASEEEIIAAVNTVGIVGANIRDDLNVIEFVCKDAASAEAAMATTFTVEGKQQFVAILPRHKTNKTVLVRIANAPFGTQKTLTKLLTAHWTQYGKVLGIAPYQFPGKPWLTKRWDILIMLNDGEKNLNAPSTFLLQGFQETVVCSWPGSQKACLCCKISGHSTSSCATFKNSKKSEKVGASANPLQKISRSTQDKNSSTKGTQSSGSGTAPANPPVSVPSVAFNVVIPPVTPAPTVAQAAVTAGLTLPTLAASDKGKGSELQCSTTPPNTHKPTDPDTPRKDKKRMAKKQTWEPMAADIEQFVTSRKICIVCWKTGHLPMLCSKYDRRVGLLDYNAVGDAPGFYPYLEEWSRLRVKKGKPPIAIVEVLIDHNCSRCGQLGHDRILCKTLLKCLHCDGNHPAIECTSNPSLFRQMKI